MLPCTVKGYMAALFGTLKLAIAMLIYYTSYHTEQVLHTIFTYIMLQSCILMHLRMHLCVVSHTRGGKSCTFLCAPLLVCVIVVSSSVLNDQIRFTVWLRDGGITHN